jgi:5-methylcytosine-specific restriction endonuclease McrA
MDLGIQNAVWERDRGICRNCGRKVTKTIDTVKDTTERLSSIKEIPVFRWSNECWKCGKETPIVTYHLDVNANHHIGDIPKLDATLARKYPFVKKTFSKTMGCEVTANTCIHCGSLQGNWFTAEDLFEKLSSEDDMNKLIDTLLPNNLSYSDLLTDPEDRQVFELKSSAGHVHHKDGNWKNDDFDNLVLLCRDCHLRMKPHGRNAPLGESRKEEKQKGREKREKRQADTWRARYYANRGSHVKKRGVKTAAGHQQRSIPDYKQE